MSEAAPQRLFVALELPDDAREALADWGRRACAEDPALRLVRADALHVTVHFLGERPVADLDRLKSVIRAAPATPIPLAATGALWLSPRRPHVLTCGLEDSAGTLSALHSELAPRLATATPGWDGDHRALRPHVTVARVRRSPRPLVGREPAPPQLRLSATAVALMRSDLASTGAVYEPLERLPLRAGA